MYVYLYVFFFFRRSTARITQSILRHDGSKDAVWAKKVPSKKFYFEISWETFGSHVFQLNLPNFTASAEILAKSKKSDNF